MGVGGGNVFDTLFHCQLQGKVCAQSIVKTHRGLSLPRKKLSRLNGLLDMTLTVLTVP